MKGSDEESKPLSRRQFLARMPLALAGGLLLGSLTGRLLGFVFSGRRGYPTFRKGSIFTPANNQYRDI